MGRRLAVLIACAISAVAFHGLSETARADGPGLLDNPVVGAVEDITGATNLTDAGPGAAEAMDGTEQQPPGSSEPEAAPVPDTVTEPIDALPVVGGGGEAGTAASETAQPAEQAAPPAPSR